LKGFIKIRDYSKLGSSVWIYLCIDYCEYL